MKRYSVTVVDTNGVGHEETHQADSWQSAILSHSMLGAEFEMLFDDEDLDARAADMGLTIMYRTVP